MVVKRGMKKIEASEMATLTSGFAEVYGGCMIRLWVKDWLQTDELPVSKRGQHMKLKSLLDDPSICAEIWAYLQSNKWATNPKKMADFTKNKMLPKEANKYINRILEKEKSCGMKQYLEVELFLRIQIKVSKGISVSTAHKWMEKQGFHYTKYKKALYYDGHERLDVVHYHQNVFLPAMAGF